MTGTGKVGAGGDVEDRRSWAGNGEVSGWYLGGDSGTDEGVLTASARSSLARASVFRSKAPSTFKPGGLRGSRCGSECAFSPETVRTRPVQGESECER